MVALARYSPRDTQILSGVPSAICAYDATQQPKVVRFFHTYPSNMDGRPLLRMRFRRWLIVNTVRSGMQGCSRRFE